MADDLLTDPDWMVETYPDRLDDSDEGFDQGDCCLEDDASLPPLQRVQKFARSTNFHQRQMAMTIVKELLTTLPAETLSRDLPDIMKELSKVEDELFIIILLDEIPHIAAQTIEFSSRIPNLKNILNDYIIPLVVRNLGCSDAAVDKAAHAALFQLIERGFINKQQVEIKVCPAVLALSKAESTSDINASTGAITLMSRLAAFLGRDVMERVFLKRFTELCASQQFYIRKICAANFGEIGNVVGDDAFENTLLPCYVALCCDEIWGVRKACAEVVMYVSCCCTAKCRRELLSPTFVKLLEDDCRWVKMAAFQSLGPFISSFADPAVTKMTYNANGDLVLVNEDGDEFRMNLSRSLSLTERMTMVNGEKGYDVVVNPLSMGMSDLSNAGSGEDMKENWLYDGYVKLFKDIVIDEELPQDKINLEKCDNPSETLYSELIDEMRNIILSANNEPVENGNAKLNPCSTISSEDGTATATNSIKDVNDNDKVNKGDNLEDDLHLFNSHIYWYISPDLPLDPSIIAGQEASNDDSPCYNAPCIENLDSTTSTESLPNDSIDANNHIGPSSENQDANEEVLPSIPEQDVIPQPLIEHFISMTDPNLTLNFDSEITYHCAYSLPAVALTLGSNNWHLLKNTVEFLASDMHYKVRKTVASGLHELATILGPEIASEDLSHLFLGFIKDLDEVRIGILKHLASFLELMKPPKRAFYLPRLIDFLRTDNEWNWRFRYELAQQLLQVVPLYKPADTAKYIGVIAIDLLCDKVAAVREIALSLITRILNYVSSEQGLTPSLLVKLAEHFAHSKKWKRRQTFCLLCSELLREQTLPPEQFASEIMPHLLDLSWDPVANVRLVVARCLAKYIINNEYFSNPNNEHCDGLETVFRRLQADKDRDVRQSAEL